MWTVVHSVSFSTLSIFLLTPFLAKLAFWVGFLLFRRFRNDSIPGPFVAKFSRLWLMRTLSTGDSAKILADTNLKYGSLARIGPNQVITDDPETIRRILGTGSKYIRGPWFDSLRVNPHMTTVVSERDPQKHRKLRAKVSAAFSGRCVNDAEPIVDHFIQGWISQIDRHWVSESSSTKHFDIGKRIQYLTVDIIARMCLGEGFGCVEHDQDRHGFLEAVHDGVMQSLKFSILQEVQTFYQTITRIPFFHRLVIPSTKDERGVGKIMGIIHDKIRASNQQPRDLDKKGAMLDYLCKQGFPPEEIATLLAIILNPVVYTKLRDEIDTAVRSGTVSSPIKDAESRQLPYLQACIREGLRRHPPIGQLRERLVPSGGDTVLGYKVRGGTYVATNAWGCQLSRVFGPDPEMFRPERWIVDDPQRVQAMRSTQELVFGHGTTKCLGMSLATLELNKAFFELFRHFDVSIANPYQPWRSKCWGLFFQEGFEVRITRRTQTV